MSFQVARANKIGATGAATSGAVTVTTSATLAAADNDARVALSVVNFGSVTIYWGKDSSVTTSTGIPILAGQSVEDRDYTGPVYLIASSGSVNVRVWEVGGV